MKELKFAIQIAASREKVWHVLWDDATYRQWTRIFAEGSHAVSDWNEGDKIQFLGPSGDGMYSTIAKLQPNEFISFEHLGEIKGGQELPKAEWSGSTENYALADAADGTELGVAINISEEYEEYFADTFPKALEVVKTLSES